MKAKLVFNSLAVLALPLLPTALASQESLLPLRTDTPPVIDGRLDDPVWEEAPYVTGFRTWRPDFEQPMFAETSTYMAYDAINLYFAFRCLDPEPDQIKASVTNRDNIVRDDWVAINLDSFNDQQALYAFYVNPLGIQGDTRYAAGQEDPNVDLVWYSGGRIDEEGYTVEISIPLKSIRFLEGDTVSMGVIFERSVSRHREAGTYPPLDPAQGESWLTQTMPMVYQGLERETLVEILPAVTYSNAKAIDQGRLATQEDQGDFSLTAKYGLTSHLVFDGTVNPDFSQVEADAGQVDVNLRYQLYFPEKRAFFREGGEHFAVAATGASPLDPVGSIVYTRTIVDPIAGGKLTGKVGSNGFLASIYAMDELPAGSESDHAHVPILRYKHALKADGYLGGIYAGRELSDRFNRVGGLDGLVRLTGAATLGYHALWSQTDEGPESANEGGHALGVRFTRSTRDLDLDLVAKEVSDGFRAETGFVWRTGIRQVSALARPKFYPGSDIFRRIDVDLFSGQTHDRMSDRWETYNRISVRNHLFGNLNLSASYSHSTEIFLDEKFNTGGWSLAGGGQFNKQVYLSVSYRKTDAIFYSADPYQGRSTRASARLTYQPSDKIGSDFNLTYVDFHRESDGEKIYDYPIYWGRLTYQLNKYLLFRGIAEYNDYREELLTDLLVSFTYIPGTVVHLGYGSLRDRIRWDGSDYVESDRFLETKRKLFFKASYLWRK